MVISEVVGIFMLFTSFAVVKIMPRWSTVLVAGYLLVWHSFEVLLEIMDLYGEGLLVLLTGAIVDLLFVRLMLNSGRRLPAVLTVLVANSIFLFVFTIGYYYKFDAVCQYYGEVMALCALLAVLGGIYDAPSGRRINSGDLYRRGRSDHPIFIDPPRN